MDNRISAYKHSLVLDTKQSSIDDLKHTCLRVRLEDSIVNEIQRTARDGGSVQLVLGKSPAIRIASIPRSLKFAHTANTQEIYKCSPKETNPTLIGEVHFELQLKELAKAAASAEAASLQLKERLNAIHKEREHNKATVIEDAKLKSVGRHGLKATNIPRGAASHSRALSNTSTTSSSTSPLTGGLSQPSEHIAREEAQRASLMHLLAMGPQAHDDIIRLTGMQFNECTNLLERLADRDDNQWRLKRKSFQKLDIWRFPYETDDDRQKAIDNAITAFDRDRVDTKDPLRQKLLPKRDRGKGIFLSNLHLDLNRRSLANSSNQAAPPSTDHRKLLSSTPRVQTPDHVTSGNENSQKPAAYDARFSTNKTKTNRITLDARSSVQPGSRSGLNSPALPAESSPRKKAVSESRAKHGKASEGGAMSKKRKQQPAVKSNETIHDSDEEAREADEHEARLNKKQKKPSEDASKRSARSKQAASVASARRNHHFEEANKLARAAHEQSSASTSHASTASSISASSPMTPLGTSPDSTGMTYLQRRYEEAFAKHVHAQIEGGDTSATAEYEQIAQELAESQNSSVEELYIPTGYGVFPAEALAIFAQSYNEIFTEYATARDALVDSTKDHDGEAATRVGMLQRRLRYYKALWEAAAESKSPQES